MTLHEQKQLKDLFIVKVKNQDYLLVANERGNHFAINLKDLKHLYDLTKSNSEELNFNYKEFSFFKSFNIPSAFLILHSIPLIYSSEDDLVNYMNKKDFKFKFNFSAFDCTTSTLLIYNPMIKTLNLIDCEFELQRMKSKIRLFQIDKKKNPQLNKQFILKSGRTTLAVNQESFLETRLKN